MALSDDEKAVLTRLEVVIMRGHQHNHKMDAYYDGEQRLEQLGLAIPPELRRFLTIVAWPGTYADAIEERIDLEGFRLPFGWSATTPAGWTSSATSTTWASCRWCRWSTVLGSATAAAGRRWRGSSA
jgi:hypothetical protein